MQPDGLPWFWLPETESQSQFESQFESPLESASKSTLAQAGLGFSVRLGLRPVQIGTAFLRVWIQPAEARPGSAELAALAELGAEDRLVGLDNSSRPRGVFRQLVWPQDDPAVSRQDDLFGRLVGARTPVVERAQLGLRIIVLKARGVKDVSFQITLMVLVILLTFTMSCSLNIKVILSYAKRPIGPAIGFSSQYVVMPLVSWSLQMTPFCASLTYNLYLLVVDTSSIFRLK
ncbi:unnamed protein product [Protopolystoma xenopodis]|uniref:Uncharacterized protein n=1 Tax=Protopolystoma xenopodis TaxID=117903 RepID=A0A3S5CQF0_9PLAT|nr:unnamed protein product [Protopolystoma xenopodis]